MVDVAGRLRAIRTELDEALATLDDVLTHVDTPPLAANLRVTISNSVIVALVSTTEETIRNLFSEYLAILEETISSFSRLRSDVQEANVESAIRLLGRAKKPLNWMSARQVVDSLRGCLSEQPNFSLFKDDMTFNEANFRSQQITRTAKRAGISEVWQRMCDANSVLEYVGEENLDSRKNKLIKEWEEIFDERDLIVHRISQASGWNSQRIRQAAGLTGLIVARLCECLIADAGILIAIEQQQVARALAAHGGSTADAQIEAELAEAGVTENDIGPELEAQPPPATEPEA